MVKYKLVAHEPTPEEIETTEIRYQAFRQFRQEFKNKYGLTYEKDQRRAEVYGQGDPIKEQIQREMVLIGDIEGPNERRVEAIKEWTSIEKLSKPVWPEFDVVVVADYE